jgi:uncharacterized BrkB/YihY/UPF0761 family membrane protein
MRPGILPRALGWLARQRFLRALFWVLAILLITAAVNVIGIRIIGDVTGWAQWLEHHRLDFLLWRLALYGATAWGWWWMHGRVRRREPEAHGRLLRIEIAAVLVILVLEGVALLQP